MERVLEQNERIRRAQEIYEKRQNLRQRTKKATLNVSDDEPKHIKTIKRMCIQIIICVLIYFIFYLINTTSYSFSEETLSKTNELISNDVDFAGVYNAAVQTINDYIYSINESEEENSDSNEEIKQEESIENSTSEEETEAENEADTEEVGVVEESETERIKEQYSFISPLNRRYGFIRVWDKSFKL